MADGAHFSDHEIRPLPIVHPGASVPTALDEYLFDLNGYVVLPGVLAPPDLVQANALIDTLPQTLARGGWHGWVQREDHADHRGVSFQQVYELGGVFEAMIDHPRYLNYVLRFLGGQGIYEYYHGPAAIDENFVTLRGPGEAIPIHSGGHERARRPVSIITTVGLPVAR